MDMDLREHQQNTKGRSGVVVKILFSKSFKTLYTYVVLENEPL